MMIHPIILCGGIGTRLWPLSRQQFPKQFVPLIEGRSLLGLSALRMRQLSDQLTLVTGAAHRFLARDALKHEGLSAHLILEPEGRNTAPAMAAAALDAKDRYPGEDPLLLFAPADNYIPEASAFCDTVRAGVERAAQGWWVIAGVCPSYPATGYGYIAASQPLDPSERASDKTLRVERFIEKPPLATAAQLILQGNHFWNAGVFLVKTSVLMESLQTHGPGIVETVQAAIEPLNGDGDRHLNNHFRRAQNISIDYAVLEKHNRVAMLPYSGVWSDVGSWTSVAELGSPPDTEGNRCLGKAYPLIESRRNFIHAQHKPVVTVGVEDLLIIDTPDALLVAHRDAAERVKDAVGVLQSQGLTQIANHRSVARPWGSYDSIDAGDRFLVKRITVNPGASLSLQMHHHRAEHWIVVKGTAKVTRGEEVFILAENESTFIPLGVKHRLENPGLVPLAMIEVQSGSYLSEDDIVRFSDQYGRA